MKICLNCVRNSINSHSAFPVVVILWYSVLRKSPPCVDIFWIDSEWMFRLLHCMLKLGSGLQQHVRLVPTNNLCWCRWWWWGWCWCWWCLSKDIVFNSMFVWFLQNGDDHQADSDNYNHLFLSNSDESSDLQLVVSLSRSARWWSATLWLARVTRSLVTIKMVIMKVVMVLVIMVAARQGSPGPCRRRRWWSTSRRWWCWSKWWWWWKPICNQPQSFSANSLWLVSWGISTEIEIWASS